MNVIFVILAVIATWIVSLITMPVVSIVILIPFCSIIPKLDEKKKKAALVTLQSITYGLSTFLGLMAGVFILKKVMMVRFFPLLVALLVLSCLAHLARPKSAVIPAQKITVTDKIANIIGTILGSVIAYLFLYR
jgi:hypothetical protein